MARTRPTQFNHIRLDFTPMARRRRWLGMTQRQLADAVGVHPVTINRVEKNRTEPTLRQMISASRALGVPLEEILPTLVEVKGADAA